MASFRFRPPISLWSRLGVVSVLVLFSFVFVSFAQSEVWRDPSGTNYVYHPSNNYPSYDRDLDQSYYRRSNDRDRTESEEEWENTHNRRSATSSHGRSVLFKSLVLAPLALVVFFLLILLIIPIPVVAGGNGRSLASSINYSSTMKLARDVLVAEECVERVSCELSRISKAHGMAWIPTTLENILTSNNWGERIVKGFQTTSRSNSKSCTQFTCNAAKNFKRSLKMK